MWQGAIVDATLIAAPSSTKNKEGKRDPTHVRTQVEHPFRVIKRQFGFHKTRLRGMAKNRCKVNVISALTNLFLARRLLWLGDINGGMV